MSKLYYLTYISLGGGELLVGPRNLLLELLGSGASEVALNSLLRGHLERGFVIEELQGISLPFVAYQE